MSQATPRPLQSQQVQEEMISLTILFNTSLYFFTNHFSFISLLIFEPVFHQTHFHPHSTTPPSTVALVLTHLYQHSSRGINTKVHNGFIIHNPVLYIRTHISSRHKNNTITKRHLILPPPLLHNTNRHLAQTSQWLNPTNNHLQCTNYLQVAASIQLLPLPRHHLRRLQDSL